MKLFDEHDETMNEQGREAHAAFAETVKQFLAGFSEDVKLRELQYIMCHAIDSVITTKIYAKKYPDIDW